MAWERYFLLPASLLNTLKILALDRPSTSKSGVGISDLRIDLSLLIKDQEGEEVFIIETEVSSTGRSLVPEGRRDRIWPVKDGLLENEDFVFVSSEGWNKLLSW